MILLLPHLEKEQTFAPQLWLNEPGEKPVNRHEVMRRSPLGDFIGCR
jgi:hypothetical protein